MAHAPSWGLGSGWFDSSRLDSGEVVKVLHADDIWLVNLAPRENTDLRGPKGWMLRRSGTTQYLLHWVKPVGRSIEV